MIQLEPGQAEIINSILAKYPYQFYAFGSRTKGKARKFSDLDLCYKEEIPLHVITILEEEFEESDLPFKVELVNWHHCSEEFKEIIAKDLILIKPNA